MNFEIGDTVKALVDNDGIDTLDMSLPYEVFNFIKFEKRVGIVNGRHWYYLKPDDLELWSSNTQ